MTLKILVPTSRPRFLVRDGNLLRFYFFQGSSSATVTCCVSTSNDLDSDTIQRAGTGCHASPSEFARFEFTRSTFGARLSPDKNYHVACVSSDEGSVVQRRDFTMKRAAEVGGKVHAKPSSGGSPNSSIGSSAQSESAGKSVKEEGHGWLSWVLLFALLYWFYKNCWKGTAGKRVFTKLGMIDSDEDIEMRHFGGRRTGGGYQPPNLFGNPRSDYAQF